MPNERQVIRFRLWVEAAFEDEDIGDDAGLLQIYV